MAVEEFTADPLSCTRVPITQNNNYSGPLGSFMFQNYLEHLVLSIKDEENREGEGRGGRWVEE